MCMDYPAGVWISRSRIGATGSVSLTWCVSIVITTIDSNSQFGQCLSKHKENVPLYLTYYVNGGLIVINVVNDKTSIATIKPQQKHISCSKYIKAGENKQKG